MILFLYIFHLLNAYAYVYYILNLFFILLVTAPQKSRLVHCLSLSIKTRIPGDCIHLYHRRAMYFFKILSHATFFSLNYLKKNIGINFRKSECRRCLQYFVLFRPFSPNGTGNVASLSVVKIK